MEPPFLARYRERVSRTWSDDTPIDRVRFVVLDSETTGLNPRTDRLITIGAVAVVGGEDLRDVFVTTSDSLAAPQTGGAIFRAKSEVAGMPVVAAVI